MVYSCQCKVHPTGCISSVHLIEQSLWRVELLRVDMIGLLAQKSSCLVEFSHKTVKSRLGNYTYVIFVAYVTCIKALPYAAIYLDLGLRLFCLFSFSLLYVCIIPFQNYKFITSQQYLWFCKWHKHKNMETTHYAPCLFMH